MDSSEQKAVSNLKIFAVLLLVGIVLSFVPFISIIGSILSIVALIFLMLSFKLLSGNDKNFKMPFEFTLLSLIGLVLMIAGLFVMFGSAVLSAGFSNIAASLLAPSVSTGGLIAGTAMMIVGAILALIGFIAGVILGLWRVGKKYNSSMISIGAIFLIIPVLDIVGTILIIVGLLKLQ